ncbi:MAG: hypothetical protein QM820_01975 [Minicystis sp.]
MIFCRGVAESSNLLLQVAEQLLVVARAVVDAVEALERRDAVGIEPEGRVVAARGLGQIVHVIFVQLGDLADGLDLRLAGERLGAALQDLGEAGPVLDLGVDALERDDGLRVARVLGEDRLVEVAGVAGLVEARLQEIGGLGAEVAGLGGRGRAVGAGDQDLAELLPLLGAAVDLGEAFEGGLVRGIDREHGLEAGDAEVGARDLLRVPAAQAGEEGDLRLRRHARVGRDLRQLPEGLGPELHVAAGGALQVDGVVVVGRLLAEGLGEGERRLLLVVQLPEVEVADLVERPGALGVAVALVALLEEHLHQLLVLAQAAAQLLQGGEGDLVLGVELDDARVHGLGALLVAEDRLADARGAEEERLLELLVLELLALALALLDLVGGDLEGLDDLGGVGALLDGALQRQGGLAVGRVGEEEVDLLVEVFLAHLLVGLGLGLGGRLERLEHGARVLRPARARLAEEAADQLVELLRHPAARGLRAGGGGRAGEVRDGEIDARLARERRLAGEDLEEHGAERVEIAGRVGELAAEQLRARRLEERGARPLAEEAVAADVEEHRARRAALAAADEDVLQLDGAVGELLLVQGRERAEHAAEDGARLVDVERAGAGDARRQRLPLDGRVGDVGAVVGDPRLEITWQVLVPDLGGEPHAREVAAERPRVARGLAAEDLEGALGAVLGRGVDDGARALGDLLADDEGAEGVAALQLLGLEDEPLLAKLADARVHLGARRQHGVEQRLHGVDLDATIGEGARERSLRRSAPDLAGRQAEQIGRQGHHFIEREEALELAAHDIDGHWFSSRSALRVARSRPARREARVL